MYRNIELILYDYSNLLDIIALIHDMEYAFILHDKDIDVKPHYHLLIFNKDAKTLSAWSKFLNIPQNMIEKVDDKKRKVRYLIHLDSKQKYQYDAEDIVSNFDTTSYLTCKSSELDDMRLITNYIDTSSYVKFKFLKDYVLQNGLWSSYRRNYTIIRDLVYEHNLNYPI